MSEHHASRGRREGNPDTRAAIVAAARRVLTERGVQGASLRAIAAEAGVNASLIIHFFGDKAGLVEAAIDWPFDLAAARGSVMDAGLDEVGARLVRLFAQVWDEAGESHPVLVLLRVAGTDQRAAAQLVRLLRERLLSPLWPALQATFGDRVSMTDAAARGDLIAAQLLGIAVARYVLRLDAIAALTPDELAESVGPSLQRLIVG